MLVKWTSVFTCGLAFLLYFVFFFCFYKCVFYLVTRTSVVLSDAVISLLSARGCFPPQTKQRFNTEKARGAGRRRLTQPKLIRTMCQLGTGQALKKVCIGLWYFFSQHKQLNGTKTTLWLYQQLYTFKSCLSRSSDLLKKNKKNPLHVWHSCDHNASCV